ncbi:MAG: heme-binding protein [Deltaproteobacteria bacterium]|nr:heme-binding protein [Deltaproteobacteria bacterium]
MITVQRLTLADALIMIEASEKKAAEMGVPMDIAVCDDGGNLVAFHRMDGGKITSIAIAIDKAFTAAAARRATHDYSEMAAPGKAAFGIHTSNQGRFSIIGGGLPVTVSDQVVGGIGASSGTAAQDRIVAQAGLDAFLGSLR